MTGKNNPIIRACRVVGTQPEPYREAYQPVGAHAAQEYRQPRHRNLGLRHVAGRFAPQLRREYAGQHHQEIGEEGRPDEIPRVYQPPVAQHLAPSVPAAQRPGYEHGVVAREELRPGEYHQDEPQREYQPREQALQPGASAAPGNPNPAISEKSPPMAMYAPARNASRRVLPAGSCILPVADF